METRSRKRAEASSAAPSNTNQSSSSSSTRPTKRARSAFAANAATASAPPSITTRSRAAAAAAAAAAENPTVSSTSMDTEANPSSSSSSSRRRGRSHRPGSERDPPSDKGKDRESAEGSRARDRDVERILGLSFDSGGGGDADADASAAAANVFHQNLTSASSALQGLLRKLGAGLDDLLPSSGPGSGSSSSHQSGRLKKILSGLRADGEEGKQVEALTQLCEMLSIGTEDSLGSFSVDSFVPVLVGLLNHESNPDIMLLAARALTHLVDVLPSSCSAVVHYGAIPCFCARLLTIEYMDLAEQSLQALKKISQEHPTACLRAGALMAVLSYLDFFSTGVQRVALSTAANMCRKLPSDAADFVMDAVPLLTNLLHYHDSKVLDHASVCLTRIAEAFASSPEKLDALCNHGLVAQAAGLISISNTGGGQASLSTSTYTGLIRLLSTCASGSPLASKTLLLLGISGILKDILSGSGLVGSISVAPALTRPTEQIYEIVTLADELLPPLPQGTISLPICSNILIKGSTARKSSACSSVKQEEASGSATEVSTREKLLHDQPELLQQFGGDLLPVLIQVYGSSVNGPVRHRCLSVIGKLMYFSTADMIRSLLGSTNISRLFGGVLAWKDPQVLIPALQIADILMEKLPETFSKMFVREGVVHAVDSLIQTDPSSAVPSQASFEKDNDSVAGASSRSRRYRRRSGGPAIESSTSDEPKAIAHGNFGSPPSSTEVPNANSSFRATVSECAKAFKEKFFSSEPGAHEVGVTEELLRLKDLCTKLNGSIEDIKTKAKGKKSSGVQPYEVSAETEEYLNGVISDMLIELAKGDSVSTFEFIGSGVVSALLNYFSCGTFGKERISEANIPKLRQQALKRYKSFISIALPIAKEGNEAPMALLVQKLQSALSSLERFPVVLSHSSRLTSGTGRLSSGLSALAQPFKLRLCRAPGEKSLRDYSSNIVLIDPLASLAAVEDFLWPRVQRNDVGQKPTAVAGSLDSVATAAGAGASSPSASTPASGRRPATRSRSSITIGGSAQKDNNDGNASSSKGKGKAVLKSNPDERGGPQTRNAARRKATSDKEAEMKPAHADSSSEDEDMHMSPADMDDALVIEDDDVSDDEDDDHEELLRDDSLPVCMPDMVLDVKLGEPTEDAPNVSSVSDNQAQVSAGSTNKNSARGLESTDCRGGSAFGSRGAMSFAAAAMAGLASVGGRGIRGSRDRRGLPRGGNINEHYNKLIFTAGGKHLSKNLTIYQAVQRQLVLDDDEDDRCSDMPPSDGSRFWSDIFTITYEKADNQVDRNSQGGSGPVASKSSKSGFASGSTSGEDTRQHMSLLDSILQGELPCDLEKSNPTYNILALLRVLEGLNQLAPRLRMQAVSDNFAEGKIINLDELYRNGAKVSPEEFINSKLTPKLARQIQDALALCSGSLPSWCYQMTKACPFLFPFETRRQYFYSTAFGLSRALHRLQQEGADTNASTSEREVRVGRLQRQKVRVSRNRILDSAIKVMEMYSSQKAVLEVEYFGEVGTGLGPTLEFYTLLSRDLQKVTLGMWRSSSESDKSTMQIDGDKAKYDSKTDSLETTKLENDSPISDAELVQAPLGLFPRPWPPNVGISDGSQFSKVVEYFRLVGRVMAKALQDGRLLDIPLSVAFYKLVLGQELDLHDILSFDTEFGKILQEMQVLVQRKKYLENSGEDKKAIDELRFRGVHVEDLCLNFILPGYPDYILKEGGESTMVDINNLEEYLALVVDATVKTGIMRQMEALIEGFNQVFDFSSLRIFSPSELDYLLCGRRELWEPETLADHIKFDHGYTAKSPVILNLLEIMGEFTPEQQHAFCQFVTGAPRLAPGGLAALNPKLTIVRKHSSSTANMALNGSGPSESADDDLPSVMTCANYLKLPPYSTKEIMYKKLLYAVNEGQGSFDLS